MKGEPVPSVVTLTCADLGFVETLRARNTGTLGFLAEGALSHYLASGGGLGSKTQDGRLVAYLLFARHRNHIRIIHLCVADEARGAGYAKLLVNRLTDIARQHDVGVIKLNCRRDYPAHHMWSKLGFVPLSEKPAKTSGRRLTQWCLAVEGYREPDLFHVTVSDEKVNAVIDAQIFFHLHESDVDQAMASKGLQADFLEDLLQLYITDEMFVEIDRARSDTRRKVSRGIAYLFPQISHDPGKAMEFVSVLSGILPTATESQKSDVRQLAKTAASDVGIFLTLDQGLLRAADRIEQAVAVRVLSPTRIIIQLDELTDPDSYVSIPLSGSNLAWRKLDHEYLAGLQADHFLAPSEKRHHFHTLLNDSLSQPKLWQTQGIWSEGDLVALRAIRIQPDMGRVTVNLCRAFRGPDHKLFTRFTIASILHEAVRSDCGEIHLLPHGAAPDAADELRSLCFARSAHGFVRLCLTEVVSSGDLQRRLHDAGCPEVDLHAVEKTCSPVVLTDSSLDCFMIPIKSGYARGLFDTNLARDDMFGAEPGVLLRWTNVYYRRKSHHRMLRAPARLLWYESGSDARVVAVSHLDDVRYGSPKEMFRDHRRLGVLAWPDIYEMCSGSEVQDIMVLRFSHTHLFNRPVLLEELRSLYAEHGVGLVLQSPSTVPRALFWDIFRAGFDRQGQS